MDDETIHSLSLAGTWQVALDREDSGVAGAWPKHALPREANCRLPGSIQEQNLGDEISPATPWIADISRDDPWYTSPRFEVHRRAGQVKIPYFLQPLKHYVGVVWFEREFEIPADWSGQQLSLSFERAHWQTRCWIDGNEIGSAMDSLATPHCREVQPLESGKHRLSIRVDNRMIHAVGPNSHSVSDHTQGAWNGIVGGMNLSLRPDVMIEALAVFAEPGERSIRVTGRVDVASIAVDAEIDERAVTVTSTAVSAGRFEACIILDEPLSTWDEFAPTLHTLKLSVSDGATGKRGALTTRFGVRRFAADGTRLMINGRPTFLRGTLDCCIFPMTGYPPTDLTAWQHVMGTVRAYGLNHIRFHSYCPPEAAFVAADEAGVYLHVECGSWANQGATVGDGHSVDQWLYDEAQRIVDTYGNHPSFGMLAYGNEPAGEKHLAFLTQWVECWKVRDPRRLHTSAAGWPALPVNDFQSIWQPRIQAWGAGLASRINANDPETETDYRAAVASEPKPIVTHEIGQWCVYPNLAEIEKYTGALRATNIEIVRDSLRARRMEDLASEFVIASGKLQVLCYKEEIESQLRTPGLGGFQLLGLQDFPGQGMATVGVVDAFWDAKPYVSAAEFRRFCNATVILARMPRRIFADQDSIEATLLLSHFAGSALHDAMLDWRVEDLTHGGVVAQGTTKAAEIGVGELKELGSIRVPLSGARLPAQLRLSVSLRGSSIANDWDLWAYPSRSLPPEDVLICQSIDDAFVRATEAGRPVLLCPGGQLEAPEVALGFSSIFWNTLFTRNQPPHTLGILCDPNDPLLAQFPTESHSNWQWSEPIRNARCLMLDRIERLRIEPIVRVIDDWNENRSLGLLAEARVGKSRVAISGVDLSGTLANRHASRQLRTSIASALSGRADPRGPELSIEEVRQLIAIRRD